MSALKNSMCWNIRILRHLFIQCKVLLEGGGNWIYHPLGCWCLQSAKWNSWTGASCQEGWYWKTMINWSYLLSWLSTVFLFRGACRQNGGVGEQTFAIFDSSLQSWGCLQNWHSDQQSDLFCIFYILLRLIRWDHYQIVIHIYHRGHVVSQLLARHLWDW